VVSETVVDRACRSRFLDVQTGADSLPGGASARPERARKDRGPVAWVLSIVTAVPQQVVPAAGPDRQKEPSS
jgi:hypothetical protein